MCMCVCKTDEAVWLTQRAFDEMERGSTSVCHPCCFAFLRACVHFLYLSACVCECVQSHSLTMMHGAFK